MKGLFFTLSVIFLLLGCKTINETQKNTLPEGKRYAIGQGGGFTGDYTEYILSEGGKVYKYDFNYDREVFYKTLEKVDLNYFLEQIENLGLEGIEIDKPGNISTYIDVRVGNISINKITWGATLYYPPNNLVDFHKELFDKLKELD